MSMIWQTKMRPRRKEVDPRMMDWRKAIVGDEGVGRGWRIMRDESKGWQMDGGAGRGREGEGEKAVLNVERNRANVVG